MIAFSLYGCDAPQRTRLVQNPLASNGSSSNFTEPGGFTNTTGTTTTPTSTTMPAGFTNCDITPKHYASGIGLTGVCQSTNDEASIMIKPTITDTTSRTCLIPTYKDASGSSAYIGQPQCLYTTENKIVNGSLFKNRSGFTQYPLNGLMIMKETSMTAYFQCMDAFMKYVSQACPYGAKTNSLCDQYARNSMSALCNTFKSSHSFIDIRLK